jgi:HEAT repeat protein
VVEALCGEDRELARQARAQLLSAGGAALPALLSRFPGPTRVDRYSSSLGALPPLEQHGPLLDVVVELGDLAAPAIASLLDVPGVDVRFYASLFFLRVRYEPILQAMYERLFDKDTQVREVVRHVLRSYRHAPAFRRLCEELHRALRGRDPWQIEQAAHALGAFHDPRAVPYLVELLETPQRRIAEVAHRELCRICLDDLGTQRRKWQRWWEDNAARPRWSWLVEAMNHGEREVRVRAALELRQVPGLLVNYNPDAPRAERSRAQVIATQFFEDSPQGRV